MESEKWTLTTVSERRIFPLLRLLGSAWTSPDEIHIRQESTHDIATSYREI